MFRGEDYLHSRSIGSGFTTTDGNESSPNPVHEDGNYFFASIVWSIYVPSYTPNSKMVTLAIRHCRNDRETGAS